MCWYLNGRKCLISYLLILRDHASLGNKHETKLDVKKSNFTVWSKLVYNDSHANLALEQILIPGSAKCLGCCTYFCNQTVYRAQYPCPTRKILTKQNLATDCETRSGIWGLA